MGPTDIHVERLREREPDLQLQRLPDGSQLISIPKVALPASRMKSSLPPRLSATCCAVTEKSASG